MDKLESDLITNECPDRCNNFTVIDHAKSLVPRRFRHKFVEKKDELLREHGSLFKALSEFLKTEASLIQKYMPDKIIEDISKEFSNSRNPIKMKAKVAQLEARVVDGKATGNNKK